MSTGKVILGVLAGLAAGAMLGVLLAPDKGTVTRQKIVKKGEELLDEMKEHLGDVVESTTEKVASAMNDVKAKTKSEPAQ